MGFEPSPSCINVHCSLGLPHTMADVVDITYLTVALSDPNLNLMAQCNLLADLVDIIYLIIA